MGSFTTSGGLTIPFVEPEEVKKAEQNADESKGKKAKAPEHHQIKMFDEVPQVEASTKMALKALDPNDETEAPLTRDGIEAGIQVDDNAEERKGDEFRIPKPGESAMGWMSRTGEDVMQNLTFMAGLFDRFPDLFTDPSWDEVLNKTEVDVALLADVTDPHNAERK